MAGDGSSIRIGANPIMGLGSSFILPRSLRDYLDDYGICSLAYAWNYTSLESRFWFKADELELIGDWKLLWENYIRGLEYGRIRLNNRQDTLLWYFNKYEGSLTASIGYDCTLHAKGYEQQDLALNFLWVLCIPLKIICFIWLLARDRILTWDHLQHKGYQGPSRCILCKKSYEDIPHLFLSCPYSVGIFAHYAAKFGFPLPKHCSVSSLLVHWYNSPLRSTSFRFLPPFIF